VVRRTGEQDTHTPDTLLGLALLLVVGTIIIGITIYAVGIDAAEHRKGIGEQNYAKITTTKSLDVISSTNKNSEIEVRKGEIV